MHNHQTLLVQKSFQQIIPVADLAAQLFYNRLFVLDPSLRPLFKHDMARQQLKLMNTLQHAVATLDDFERIVPTLQNLGRDHADYGVQDAHYATVGEALIWTLAQLLGEQFTEEVRDAWLETYNLLSSVMREAAEISVNVPKPLAQENRVLYLSNPNKVSKTV